MTESDLLKEAARDQTTLKPKRKREGLVLILVALGIFFAAKWFLFGGSVEVSGKARAVEELEIKILTEGILEEIHVENTQSVKKGEALFEFQNDSLGVDLLQTIQEKETLTQKLKRLEKVREHSEKEVQSGKVLFENGVIGKLKFEEFELKHSQHEELLAETRRKLEEISLRIKALQKEKEALTVRAPFDGIFLGDLRPRKGTHFKEGESLGILFSQKAFYLEAFLPETKARRVKLGDSAQVRFKAFGGSHKGKIIQVDEKATEEIEKVFKIKHVIRIRILLESFPEGLRPGMRGRATVLPALNPKRGAE